MINPGNKELRAKQDLKTKFLIDELKPAQTDKVKHEAESVFGPEFMQKMFSTDFKKHGQVATALQYSLETQPENLIMSIDVVFKWGIIKLLESQNTTFSGQLFDFYSVLFAKMTEIEYKLWDTEAVLIIPFVCNNLGLQNMILRDKVKALFKQLFGIYDHKLILKYVF